MRNVDAAIEDLQPYPIRRSLVVRKLLKHGLTPEADVSDEKKLTQVEIEILSQMATLNNVSEGGVSISFNKESVNKLIKSKCAEIGLDDSNYIEQTIVTRLE